MPKKQHKSLADELPLPSSVETEKFLLAACMGTSVDFSSVANQIGVDEFFLHRNKQIFSAMRELHEAGRPIDTVTVAMHIRAQETPQEGILTYLSELSDHMPTIVANVIESWCKILRDKAQLRRLITHANGIITQCLEATDGIPDILANSERELSRINSKEYIELDLQTPREIFAEHGGIDRFLMPQVGSLVPTPWPLLNWHLGGGYRGGELVVLAARPSIGKSARAMQQAVYSSFHGIGTAVFPLEMKARQILIRALSARANVDGMAMRRPGELSQVESYRILEAASDFDGLEHLWISKKQTATVGSVEASLRKLKGSGRPLRLVVIDYLQLMSGAGRYENKVQEVSAITRSLKLLAMELDVVILLLSQLSRECESQGRRPVLKDLRDSGTIEQDADIVEFLHWEKKNLELHQDVRTIENILAKQREGPLNTIDLAFHAKYTTFHGFEREEVAA